MQGPQRGKGGGVQPKFSFILSVASQSIFSLPPPPPICYMSSIMSFPPHLKSASTAVPAVHVVNHSWTLPVNLHYITWSFRIFTFLAIKDFAILTKSHLYLYPLTQLALGCNCVLQVSCVAHDKNRPIAIWQRSQTNAKAFGMQCIGYFVKYFLEYLLAAKFVRKMFYITIACINGLPILIDTYKLKITII